MELNWEEFEEGPVEANSKRLHVSINRRGNMFLNRHAIDAMGEPQAVVLLYDRRRSIIGLKPASSNRHNAYRLKRKNRASGRVLYSSNFCRRFAICPDETLGFTAAEINKDGILILDLNEVRAVRRP